MSDIKPILQWVTITKDKNDETVIIHQYDEEGNQKNIKYMLNLSEENKLDVLIGIPVHQRIGEETPIGDPFIAVDMKTGQFNVNGTSWNFMPNDVDPSSVKFRPIWFHSVRKDFSASGESHEQSSINSSSSSGISFKLLEEKITLYKIGWQFTHEDKNYQRILFFNVDTGEFSLKEKR